MECFNFDCDFNDKTHEDNCSDDLLEVDDLVKCPRHIASPKTDPPSGSAELALYCGNEIEVERTIKYIIRVT